jgi:hypothetical protein
MSDADKTPTESPIALAIGRIEAKLDTLRLDITLIRQRTDNAFEMSFAAHEIAKDARDTARAALLVRSSWLPYAISVFALLVAIVFGRR